MVSHHGTLGASWTGTTRSLGTPLARGTTLRKLLLEIVGSPLHVIDLDMKKNSVIIGLETQFARRTFTSSKLIT